MGFPSPWPSRLLADESRHWQRENFVRVLRPFDSRRGDNGWLHHGCGREMMPIDPDRFRPLFPQARQELAAQIDGEPSVERLVARGFVANWPAFWSRRSKLATLLSVRLSRMGYLPQPPGTSSMRSEAARRAWKLPARLKPGGAAVMPKRWRHGAQGSRRISAMAKRSIR